jgi:hypothetical protein
MLLLLLLHGSTLTKIGSTNQIFQCAIKKPADLALKQVHCCSSTYNISSHTVISPSSHPQNKFNYNIIFKDFIHTCSTYSHFKPGKKRIILQPTKGLQNLPDKEYNSNGLQWDMNWKAAGDMMSCSIRPVTEQIVYLPITFMSKHGTSKRVLIITRENKKPYILQHVFP